ncbi:hypothetical protein PMAYCL1PPCAC_06643, partial [Pristionchus mayeri]
SPSVSPIKMAMLLNKLRSKVKRDPAPAVDRIRGGKQEVPELKHYVDSRDYQGAISYLLFNRNEKEYNAENELWLGYCYFQSGEYAKARGVYEGLISRKEMVEEANVYLGCCFFFTGHYEEAREVLLKGASSSLQIRALCHVASKLGDNSELMKNHSKLMADSIEDSMCLASLNFLGQHYDEAVKFYQPLLNANENMIALNFYIALAEFKQESYVPAEMFVKRFLHHYPDSPAGLNLYNSIKFRAGKPVNVDTSIINNLYPAAKVLFQHNHVIFTGGTNVMQVLPTLVDEVPEARINIALYHLNREDYESAYRTMEMVEEAKFPYEYLLKGIVHLLMGQTQLSLQHMTTAREYFQSAGMDRNIQHTPNGRLAMSAYFFLAGEFTDAVHFLDSLRDLFEMEDKFNFNFGQALVMTERYKEAIEVLSRVTKLKSPIHTQFLVRAYVMEGEAEQAWQLFMKVRNSNESATLLKIIGSDSYTTNQFYWMARAYDALEKIDPSPDHWFGKRAAVSGQFMLLVKGECTGKEMSDVLSFLQNGNHSQIESITRDISSWCAKNGVQLDSQLLENLL